MLGNARISWTQLGLLGALIVAALALSGFRAGKDVIQAERVELVDRDGRRQAILSADTSGFAVTLLNEQGRPTGILRLSAEPRIAVETGRGEEVAGLGFPQVRHLTE